MSFAHRRVRALGALFFFLVGPLSLLAAQVAPASAAPPRDLSYSAVDAGPLSLAEERASFQVPPGFEVELVAAESEGIGKFITVAWDARMRLWSMTALEYPVDGNENKLASDALFAAGGRDKVVIFESPYGRPAPGAPAVTVPPVVFADGLVMPLGILPYKDGAYVQYGPDIRLYRDTNADGRADRHEVILTGFGTQDSHLFPHQFLRQPGGTIFVAQGLFNYSKVRRPGGLAFADGSTEIPFNQCKLGRFALDGSTFESLTAGPNNIWGLVTSREGETFLQEANDQGYPVIPYEPGIHVRTGSKDRLRPYQPLMPPPLAPAKMGGTGLSGLALAEDRDGLFRGIGGPAEQGVKIFFLANPITNTIQVVRANPDGPRYRFEKLPDFLTTTDRWFRPVAIHFGPDGALYIVDWYNKIISHNEVPRTHPDRDKTRGRIWRVRHRDQPRGAPPDLTKLDDRSLLAQLGGPNALVSRLAWLEIIDRRATGLAPLLEKLVDDRSVPTDRRLGALWALEGLKPVATDQLQRLAADPAFALRHEAARLAVTAPRFEAEFLAVVTPLIDDPHPSVRAALGDALRRVPAAGPGTLLLAAKLGRASLTTGSEAERYEREFERFLARWALESHPAATLALLNSPEGRALPLENRAWATLALDRRDAAVGLARLARDLRRVLSDEEVRTLAGNFEEPVVREALSAALAQPTSRAAVARSLLTLRTSFDPTALTAALSGAAQALLPGSDPQEVALGAEMAGAFRLAATEPQLRDVLRRGWIQGRLTPAALAALRALRENGLGPADLFEQIARGAAEPAQRAEALAALASNASPDAATRLVGLLPQLSSTERGIALDRLAATTRGGSALVAGLVAGTVARAEVGANTAEKLRTLLPDNPDVAALWREVGGNAQRALRLNGRPEDFGATQLTLAGAFTLECWAKLDAPIGNGDALFSAPGHVSLNFHAGQLRVWINGAGDLVVAKKKTAPGVWNHYAITRDSAGLLRIFVNGELDATSATADRRTFTGLDLGRTVQASEGTAGWLAEVRTWSVARSAPEIREHFDRSFAGMTPPLRPVGLTHVFGGADWGELRGRAAIEATDDAPVLLTDAEAAAQADKFSRIRRLATTRGNPEHGKELFTALCLPCHQHAGRGGQIAPALDGIGASGTEALLRHILTPSAAMESAYRIFRVVTQNGQVHEGFLVEETPGSILLRSVGAEDRRLLRADIRSGAYLRGSLMPEGLLDGVPPEHVSDLFAYLNSLR